MGRQVEHGKDISQNATKLVVLTNILLGGFSLFASFFHLKSPLVVANLWLTQLTCIPTHDGEDDIHASPCSMWA